MTNSKLGYYFIIYLFSIARQINELSQLKTNIRWDSHLKYSSSSVLREDCETPMLKVQNNLSLMMSFEDT